jgi:hypothetical protein
MSNTLLNILAAFFATLVIMLAIVGVFALRAVSKAAKRFPLIAKSKNAVTVKDQDGEDVPDDVIEHVEKIKAQLKAAGVENIENAEFQFIKQDSEEGIDLVQDDSAVNITELIDSGELTKERLDELEREAIEKQSQAAFELELAAISSYLNDDGKALIKLCSKLNRDQAIRLIASMAQSIGEMFIESVNTREGRELSDDEVIELWRKYALEKASSLDD